jgi:hypothetical protein
VLSHAHLHSLTIRPARDEDSRALTDLAQLDSARPLDGAILIAEAEDRPLAAIDVLTGRLIADPFHHSAYEADILRARARQLRAA